MEIFDQSAVIPFRKKNGKIEVLLISTQKANWTIPKGIVEDRHTPQESALKESVEEAGVWGIVADKKSGSYKYKKWGGTCSVKVYKMKVVKILSRWEEDHFRERLWVDIKDINKFIHRKKLANIIVDAFSEGN